MSFHKIISLHRKMRQWRWYQYPFMVKLLMHMIVKAEKEDCAIGFKYIHRGQFKCDYRSLSEETGIPMTSLRTCLKRLKETGEIHIDSFSDGSIFTVINYDKYQAENYRCENDQGWVAIYDKILNWQHYKSDNIFRVFVHFLFKADYFFESAEYGGFYATLNEICTELKLSLQSVRTALKHLILSKEITKNIQKSTQKPTHKKCFITICKYRDFSLSKNGVLTQKMTHDQHTTNTHSLLYNNIINNNNIRTDEKNSLETQQDNFGQIGDPFLGKRHKAKEFELLDQMIYQKDKPEKIAYLIMIISYRMLRDNQMLCTRSLALKKHDFFLKILQDGVDPRCFLKDVLSEFIRSERLRRKKDAKFKNIYSWNFFNAATLKNKFLKNINFELKKSCN